MGSAKPGRERPRDEVLQRVAAIFPEVGIPGFWANLESNSSTWAREVSVSELWSEAKRRLPKWRTAFRAEYHGDLLADPELPGFVGKGVNRIREKVILTLKEDLSNVSDVFPGEAGGIPRLKDLVRTRVRCRFIEGVEFIASRLLELAREHGYEASRKREGRIEGYFAQHVTFVYPLTYRSGGTHRSIDIAVEVQVATDLSSTIWESTHAIYEEARVGDDDPKYWQWRPQDPRFIARQLGHTIHLADGLLSHLRDRVTASTPPDRGTGEP